jgi:hypothetical protein
MDYIAFHHNKYINIPNDLFDNIPLLASKSTKEFSIKLSSKKK